MFQGQILSHQGLCCTICNSILNCEVRKKNMQVNLFSKQFFNFLKNILNVFLVMLLPRYNCLLYKNCQGRNNDMTWRRLKDLINEEFNNEQKKMILLLEQGMMQVKHEMN